MAADAVTVATPVLAEPGKEARQTGSLVHRNAPGYEMQELADRLSAERVSHETERLLSVMEAGPRLTTLIFRKQLSLFSECSSGIHRWSFGLRGH
mgnify:CR=1 FL=1